MNQSCHELADCEDAGCSEHGIEAMPFRWEESKEDEDQQVFRREQS